MTQHYKSLKWVRLGQEEVEQLDIIINSFSKTGIASTNFGHLFQV